MKRNTTRFFLIAVAFFLASIAKPAFAQEQEEMTFDEDEVAEGEQVLSDDDMEAMDNIDEPEPEPDLGPEPEPDLEPGDGVAVKPITEQVKESEKSHVSWNDIVVVVRKPFLKVNRLEILPTWGITMNDNIVQHQQLAGQLNYYLTDVLAVGIEGALYQRNLLEPYDQVARQARRLVTANEYKWAASLNFHYVPIYGKFAILDKHIIHWETFFTAGVGATKSKVIPRDPVFRPFENILVTPNVGVSMRFFVTKWLTVNVGMRNYMFNDKFEAANRSETNDTSAELGQNNADSIFMHNLVFQTGLSFWFPTGFEYTTFR